MPWRLEERQQAPLINFNTLYVKPLNGRLAFASLGINHDSCTVSCHGKDHSNSSYSSLPPVSLQRLKQH